jgi:hypothetical protein
VILALAIGGGELQRLLAGFSLSRAAPAWVLPALLLPMGMIAVAIVSGG